ASFFFFQAEDGIRDFHVTGVQTCALPIWMPIIRFREGSTSKMHVASDQDNRFILPGFTGAASAATPHTAMWRIELQVDPDRDPRSEERRVGKEGRARWSPKDEKGKRGRPR